MKRELQRCGEGDGAYRRHLRRGEEACKACKKAHSDAVNEWRRQPCKPREIPGCGSEGGYQRHLRNNEPTCFKCRRAHTAYVLPYTQAARRRRAA